MEARSIRVFFLPLLMDRWKALPSPCSRLLLERLVTASSAFWNLDLVAPELEVVDTSWDEVDDFLESAG